MPDCDTSLQQSYEWSGSLRSTHGMLLNFEKITVLMDETILLLRCSYLFPSIFTLLVITKKVCSKLNIEQLSGDKQVDNLIEEMSPRIRIRSCHWKNSRTQIPEDSQEYAPAQNCGHTSFSVRVSDGGVQAEDKKSTMVDPSEFFV
ncbi:hypothetical protein JTB14_028686 [Gonioctena quinquepunctata]|nr:hypothetical protein JTB14_028686 [Gonioctena quinquepunctata]